jgi:hypothetical protein
MESASRFALATICGRCSHDDRIQVSSQSFLSILCLRSVNPPIVRCSIIIGGISLLSRGLLNPRALSAHADYEYSCAILPPSISTAVETVIAGHDADILNARSTCTTAACPSSVVQMSDLAPPLPQSLSDDDIRTTILRLASAWYRLPVLLIRPNISYCVFDKPTILECLLVSRSLPGLPEIACRLDSPQCARRNGDVCGTPHRTACSSWLGVFGRLSLGLQALSLMPGQYSIGPLLSWKRQ